MSKSDNPFLKKTNRYPQKKPENNVGDRWNNIKNEIEIENTRRRDEKSNRKILLIKNKNN